MVLKITSVYYFRKVVIAVVMTYCLINPKGPLNHHSVLKKIKTSVSPVECVSHKCMK